MSQDLLTSMMIMSAVIDPGDVQDATRAEHDTGGVFGVTPISALATIASAADGGRLPYQLRVVNSHYRGEHTESRIGDANGDGPNEVIGYNRCSSEVCPIRLADGTDLEQSQLNPAPEGDDWDGVRHHDSVDIELAWHHLRKLGMSGRSLGWFGSREVGRIRTSCR